MKEKDIQGDKLRGHLETLVLAVVAQGPAHGLEVVSRLRASGGLDVKEGSVYPALYRLENAGLVQAEWEPETKGRRGGRRRIYRLTAKGRTALSRGRAEWQRFVEVIGGILGAPA